MKLIDIQQFKGEIPALSPKLLPAENATLAKNCDLLSGNLQPILSCTLVQALNPDTVSIYKNGSTWLQWNTQVDVVPSFVKNNAGRIIVTGDGYPKETNISLYPTFRKLGIPAPTNALTITIGGAAGTEVDHTTSYVYTIIGEWEDGTVTESAPSPPTGDIDVYTGQTVTLSGFTNAAEAYTTGYRIYRLNSGTTGAEFQFVHQVILTTTDYLDNIEDNELGEVLPTEGWTTPLETLSGLISTSSGINVGFSGNSIYLSETFIGYAYPESYSVTTESNIVGLGFIGSTVVVLTETKPYLLIGQDPKSISLEKIPFDQACVSKMSIVSFPGGVAYACPDGLAVINSSGNLQIITEGLYTKNQWNDLALSEMIGCWYDGVYYAFFSNSSEYIRIDFRTRDITRGELPDKIYGVRYVSSEDVLYLIIGTATTRSLYSFGTGAANLATWASKVFSFPSAPVPMAARIIGDFTLQPTVTLTGDGATIFSKVITDDDMIRFAPKRAKDFQLTVTGGTKIDRMMVAESGMEVFDV